VTCLELVRGVANPFQHIPNSTKVTIDVHILVDLMMKDEVIRVLTFRDDQRHL
jgi:hypothetical protein